ncbi:MAG: site-2 protease family protein [Nanoarchaeota archaeon]
MGFVIYDLAFLAIFTIFIILFIQTKKKNLERQGILYLYKTKFGIDFIDKIAKKYKNILMPARYVVVASGIILMATIIWLMAQSTYLYLTTQISQVIKAPPLVPLIPYFPKIFGLESLLPPLYFTYFIIAFGVVAISHEFSHGLFARLHNFKIHSTGFAFMGPILGAFVEPDEKQMAKAKKFPQLSVLAAGTFANVIMTIIFGLVLWLFFISAFSPAGLKFNTYALAEIPLKDITILEDSTLGEELVKVSVSNQIFYLDKQALSDSLEKNTPSIIGYIDSPAFRSQLKGAITEIDGGKISSYDDLASSLESLKPGDTVTIRTAVLKNNLDSNSEIKEYKIVLGEREGKSFLGVGFWPVQTRGILGKIYQNSIIKIKDPRIYYESSLKDFGWFIYFLLWWIVVINIAVALFNMLPLGILDGGRFFYLLVWGITGKEKIGKKSYQIATYALIAVVILLMARWVFSLLSNWV